MNKPLYQKFDGAYPDIIIDGHKLKDHEPVLKHIDKESFQRVLVAIRKISAFGTLKIDQAKRIVRTERREQRVMQDGKLRMVLLVGNFHY